MRSLAGLLVALAPRLVAAAPPICAPQGDAATMTAAGDSATVCFTSQKTCIQIDAKTRKSVPPPAPSMAITSTATTLCAGETCKPLGKKLAAAIAKAQKTAPQPNMPPPLVLGATADLAFATLVIEPSPDKDHVQVWDVAKDKRLTLAKPAEYAKSKEAAHTYLAYPIGKAVEVSWIACAGPCAQGVMIDAGGANKGAAFPGGPGVPLDDARVAIVPENGSGTITVVEAKTGKHLGDYKLGDDAIVRTAVARLGGDDFVALWDNGMEVKVSRMSAPAGKPVAMVWTQSIDACP